MAPCSSCGAEARPVQPSRAWWGVLVALWVVFLFVGACSAILLPLNMLLVPCWLAAASSVGPWARQLVDPRCGACGKIGSPARAPYVARRATRPAHEGAMERALIAEAQDERDLRDGMRVVREVPGREIAP